MLIAAWGENCRYHNWYKDIHELFRGYDLHCLRKKRIGFRDTLYISVTIQANRLHKIRADCASSYSNYKKP